MKNINLTYLITFAILTIGPVQVQANLNNSQSYYPQTNDQMDNNRNLMNNSPANQFKLKMREIKNNIHEICESKFDFDESILQAKLDQMQNEVNMLNQLDRTAERHDRNIRHLNNEIMRARIKCSQ